MDYFTDINDRMILCHRYDGKTNEQIGRICGVSGATIGKRMKRIRKQLADHPEAIAV